MVALPCLAVGFLMKFVAVLFVLVALTLILVVLIQKGRGGGLSGAFGGGGAGGVLGTKTGDFLTWVTIGLAAVFLILAVLMAKYYKPTHLYQPQQQSSQAGPNTPPPATSEAAATSPNTPAAQGSATEQSIPPATDANTTDNQSAPSK